MPDPFAENATSFNANAHTFSPQAQHFRSPSFGGNNYSAGFGMSPASLNPSAQKYNPGSMMVAAGPPASVAGSNMYAFSPSERRPPWLSGHPHTPEGGSNSPVAPGEAALQGTTFKFYPDDDDDGADDRAGTVGNKTAANGKAKTDSKRGEKSMDDGGPEMVAVDVDLKVDQATAFKEMCERIGACIPPEALAEYQKAQFCVNLRILYPHLMPTLDLVTSRGPAFMPARSQEPDGHVNCHKASVITSMDGNVEVLHHSDDFPIDGETYIGDLAEYEDAIKDLYGNVEWAVGDKLRNVKQPWESQSSWVYKGIHEGKHKPADVPNQEEKDVQGTSSSTPRQFTAVKKTGNGHFIPIDTQESRNIARPAEDTSTQAHINEAYRHKFEQRAVERGITIDKEHRVMPQDRGQEARGGKRIKKERFAQ